MATYATADELRTELGLDAGDEAGLPTAEAERLLTGAERRVDRLIGPWPVGPNGRKLTPTALIAPAATALREATVILAATERRDPAAFTPPAAKRVKGPDFEMQDPTGMPPAGQTAIRDAGATLGAVGLILRGALGRA